MMKRDKSEKDDFFVRGPKNLGRVNWKEQGHRRAVMACLVQGVYAMERDQKYKRQNAMAHPWWESFGFVLHRKLIDYDDSIISAIYEYPRIMPSAPKHIIAFRGTLNLHDVKLDLKLIVHCFHRTSRHDIASKAVCEIIDKKGTNVWLAGHSLGAAVAISVAKRLIRERATYLETYLFNPPYPCFQIEKIQSERVKLMIRGALCLGKAILTKELGKSCMDKESLKVLSKWVPWAFVNIEDYISMEYKGYFENRKKMENLGWGCIGRVSSTISFAQIIQPASGLDSDPTHLIPSARLSVNPCKSNCPIELFKLSHGIRQWWADGLHLEAQEFLYEDIK
ncbi:GDSL esterase/lipase [Acorus gramineus]|uniref:GDSL esterase/lipase n=1 Tax=Acorus gramineus TaxID=55184 RepID=A0AAV9AWJ3_ACOGR|nr:GDSL esterase/lipase [Acorus gramineus]